MESPLFEAPPEGTLGMILAELEVLLRVPPLPLSLPFTSTEVTVEGGVWSKAGDPTAAAGADTLGGPTRPSGTL